MRFSSVIGAAFCASLALGCGALAESAIEPSPGATAPATASATDGGARRWRVVSNSEVMLHAQPSETAAVIARLAPEAVLSNMGCAVSEDRLWCSVRPFRGGARGYAPADTLAPAAGPDGSVPIGPNTSVKRANRRDYDAVGEIPCAQEVGEALGLCNIGVARDDGGDATAGVTFPNGFRRMLFFVNGEFISASTTMSGNGRDTDWRLEDGTYLIRVDDQQYRIPHRLVFGD